jgi:hypothetical protein
MRRTVGRLGVQRGLDQVRHAFVVDRARLARAHAVVQAGNAPLDEPRAPLAHRLLGHLQPRGNRIVRLARGAGQHETSAIDQRGRQRAAARERLQLRSLVVAQHQFHLRPARSHRGISVPKIPHWDAD